MTAKPPIPRTPAEEELLSRFNGAGAGPAGELRKTAFAAFAETGLPHRRVEAYKYTDLKAQTRKVPPLGKLPETDVVAALLEETAFWKDGATHRLVFADGHFIAALSDVAELDGAIRATPLNDVLASGGETANRIGTLALAGDDASVALNTAFMQDGALIEVTESTAVDKPIELVHVTTGEVASYPRHLILVGAGASVRFVESYVGVIDAAYQVNAVAEVEVGSGASVGWVKRQEDGDAAQHLSTRAVRLGEGASYKQAGFAVGSELARSQTFLTFSGPGATAVLDNATLAQNRQHIDTTMVIDHAVPGCDSKERIKSVLDDTAKGIFQGRIVVRPDAQQTDGRMMHRALLLSEGGEAISKPELEIYADDVQCAHGSTSGEIDEDSLFYLMSRGIPRDEAERMLITAFLEEIVETIEDDSLREPLTERIGVWLSARRRTA